MAADFVNVLQPPFPVHGQQFQHNVQQAYQQAVVALVAKGVHDFRGGEGFAGAGDAHQEQAFAFCFHLRKVFHVVFCVMGNAGTAAVVVGEVPLVHMGVGQGVATAVFRHKQRFPLSALFPDALLAFLHAVAVDGEFLHFAKQLVQNVFGFVAVAAVQHSVLFVVPGMGAAAEGFFGDEGVTVFFPVVFRRSGNIIAQNFAHKCHFIAHA